MKIEAKELPELTRKEEELRSKINALRKHLSEISAKEDKQKKRKVTMIELKSRELTRLEHEHKKVVEELESKSPMYASTIEPPKFSIENFRKILKTDWCALEYFFTDDKNMVIFYLDSTTTFSVKKELTDDDTKEITACMQSYDLACIQPALLKILSYQTFIPEEIDEMLAEKKLVIISPHEKLHFIPFHALKSDKDGKYLIEKISVCYIPNLTTLSLIKASGKTVSKSLIFGNPTAELKYAEAEAVEIGKLFRPQQEVFLRKEATKEKLLASDLKKYDNVHFASHAFFTPEDPLCSGVKLYDDNLTAIEIFNIDLNTQLVALSACETAKAELLHGDELIGLSRAFFYAGTKSLLASLWSVDDETTKELMVNFYKGILSRKNKVDALRDAQVELINRNLSPFYWAAFEIIGVPV